MGRGPGCCGLETRREPGGGARAGAGARSRGPAARRHRGWEVRSPLAMPGTPRARGSLHLGDPCHPNA